MLKAHLICLKLDGNVTIDQGYTIKVQRVLGWKTSPKADPDYHNMFLALRLPYTVC